MVTKTTAVKKLIAEINQLGFHEEDQVVLLADEKVVTIKKLSPQGRFRDFASPIWEEAKKDNLTPQDINEIIHQVRKENRIHESSRI